MKWILALLSDSPLVSSKRVLMLATLILLIVCFIYILNGVPVPSEDLWVLATLCGGSAGLSVIEKKL